MKPRLIVIGNGMAGIRTLEELLAAAPDQYQITVFGAEPYGNYNRILLSAVLCGDKQLDEIVINDRPWYVQHGITLHTGADKAVIQIDRIKRTVTTRDGSTVAYDRLLLATGSTAILPAVPGVELQGVMSFRDIVDVKQMLVYAERAQHAVVLGGGLLGLEAANGLQQRGMSVTLVHNHASLLNRQLDAQAAQLLQTALQQRGIQFRLSSQLQAILGEDGQVHAVQLASGENLPCALLVAAIGVNPNTQLAKAAGLYCERGIVVNDTLQTYDPSIYAVGECIQHRGQTFGLVAPLYEQAKVCANHLSEHGVANYTTLPAATKLKVTGIQVFSVGDFLGAAGSESLIFCDAGLGIYKKLVLKANRLIGAVLYGDTADGAWYQQLVESATEITAFRDKLLFGPAYV